MADFSAKEKFDALDSDRSSTLTRAENNAKVTIPYLFMEEGSSSNDDLTTGYAQGFGAKLVNHLTGKFALSILPPSQSFYRLSASFEAMQRVTEGNEIAKQEIESLLATAEDGIMRYINNTRFRKSLYPALRLAMVTGECLVEKLDEDKYIVHGLRNYVVERDSAGNLITVVIKEMVSYKALPEDIRNSVDEPADDTSDDLELYTCVYLDNEGKINSFQEVSDEVFNENTLKSFTDKFINVRWNVVDGEDYARSFVEEHYETFVNLEKQMKVLVENAVVSSKTVFTVNPNGFTRLKDYTNAKNGDVISGNETDIGTIRVNKGGDLQITLQLVQDLKRELAESFLMSSAGIRDAERVTAQEVQLIASELEASFGGIYTAIASDIQLPLVENAISSLKIEGMDEIDVIITSGVEALGRNVEQAKTMRMIQDLGAFAQLVGQEVVAQSLNPDSIISSIINNSGVGNKDFMLKTIQKEANINAQKQEALAEQVAMGGASQAGANMANQITQ